MKVKLQITDLCKLANLKVKHITVVVIFYNPRTSLAQQSWNHGIITGDNVKRWGSPVKCSTIKLSNFFGDKRQISSTKKEVNRTKEIK